MNIDNLIRKFPKVKPYFEESFSVYEQGKNMFIFFGGRNSKRRKHSQKRSWKHGKIENGHSSYSKRT